MKKAGAFSYYRAKVFFIGLLLLTFLGQGCSLKEIHKQTQVVENMGTIEGKIEVSSTQEGTLLAALYRDENGIPALIGQHTVSQKGEFLFSDVPGDYYIAAYIDNSKDGEYQPGEHGNFYGLPTKVPIVAQTTTMLSTIFISGLMPETEMKAVNKKDAIWNNTGSVVTLDDPRFGRENYAMGLWKPVDFLNQAEGGLFFLREYQQNKLPVILVHGVNGGPLDWENVINGLNKEHFQPLVAYYPSGLRLDMISDYLVEAITMLQEKHGFSDYAVVAHSMGGLVTRSFVKKYVRHSKENSKKLKLVMTVNSPMAGMSAAASGVEHSPIVVPSWRDVEPNSEFLKDLHTWEWPKYIPYHLIISYTDGKSSDGVVPLQSQSPMRLQSEATRMYIFNDDHVGTLNNDKFIETLNMVLSTALTR